MQLMAIIILQGELQVPFSSISTVPYYKLNSLSSSVIPTDGVGQAAAINNIKSALNSNQPVVYSFRLPGVGSTTFDNFWDNYPEMSYVYDPSVYNDYMLDNPAWAHAVLIVGYDNSADTSIPYWIVVNSWGAPSNRSRRPLPAQYDHELQCGGLSIWGYNRSPSAEHVPDPESVVHASDRHRYLTDSWSDCRWHHGNHHRDKH